ncbi:hypothetical protein DM01DRAFT_1230303 [Hesseltinella vesiculosa]|uniref:G-protein coupled receptors family 2 profile 2 domain-containing protein n=1 Tax=Hesseltinella vesiculosa TaxID=101127 RepID=A0A1X2GN92_9FUNG|nr:hypothetical protein DM01DRAFT_1230303 [Hesseltinella vesiculosa]
MEPNLSLIYTNGIFLFERSQFETLRRATLGASMISLVSAFFVLLTFVYILVVDSKKANRISLRCVVTACTADGIQALMNIVMSLVPGPQSFCRAGGVIANCMRLISASFLAIVGFNLVLIFVLNVKRRDLLEYFYYPGTILYVTICISVSIYFVATSETVDNGFETCWYMNFILDRSHTVFSWMWYYAFLFFINFLAMISSVAALLKLVSEQRQLRQQIDNNMFMGGTSTNQGENRFQRKQNAILSKVVVRCIIYPLIPLVMNIWGFVIQIFITLHEQQPSFGLSMLDTIFANLEGFCVAMVYFTDPAFTAFVHDRLSYWRRMYVEEYRLVEMHNDDPDIPYRHPKSRTLFIMPLEPPSHVPVWDSAVIHGDPKSRTKDASTRQSLPMRRIRIPPSTLAQLSVNYNIRQLSYCTLPSVDGHHPQESITVPPSISSTTHLTTPTAELEDNTGVIHEVFVPYRTVTWAKLCHGLFSGSVMKYFCTMSSSSSSNPISSSTIELRSYAATTRPSATFDRDVLEDQVMASKRRVQAALTESTKHY